MGAVRSLAYTSVHQYARLSIQDMCKQRVLIGSCHLTSTPEFWNLYFWPLLSTVSSEPQHQGLKRFGISQLNAKLLSRIQGVLN